jgi:hypothetical protein
MKTTLGVFAVILAVVAWICYSIIYMQPPLCRTPWDHHYAVNSPCTENLREIDSSKEFWAIATHKEPGAAVDVGEVNDFLKGGEAPACPLGGVYTYNAVGERPTCSLGSTTREKVRLGLFSWTWSRAHIYKE